LASISILAAKIITPDLLCIILGTVSIGHHKQVSAI